MVPLSEHIFVWRAKRVAQPIFIMPWAGQVLAFRFLHTTRREWAFGRTHTNLTPATIVFVGLRPGESTKRGLFISFLRSYLARKEMKSPRFAFLILFRFKAFGREHMYAYPTPSEKVYFPHIFCTHPMILGDFWKKVYFLHTFCFFGKKFFLA